MNHRLRMDKLEALYMKCLEVMDEGLGSDKDTVYAACTAMTTVSREMGIAEKALAKRGELTVAGDLILGWADVRTEIDTSGVQLDA